MLTSPCNGEVELSPEQQSVFTAINQGRNVFVTGSAGTGKSTLLNALVKTHPFDLHITASTGIAAVNVMGTTLHRWGGIIPEIPQKEVIETVMKRKGPAYARLRDSKMLAIDEISMLDSDLMDTVDLLLKTVRRSTEPFGGLQLILFGDFLQLPPVKGRFAFLGKAWGEAQIKNFHLTRVFRQEDEAFSSALNQLRLGRVTPEIVAILASRKGRKLTRKIKPVCVYSKNYSVDQENERMLKKLTGKESTWTAQDYGEPGPLKTIQKNCLAPEILSLKEGAQVMCLWNIAPEDGVANGSIGIVTSIRDNIPTVKFLNGLEMEMERKDWQARESGRIIAGRSQIPLRLAYAITAHKCQGMTMDSIEVFLKDCFAPGQAYVALSRCRTLEGLHIPDIDYNRITAHPEALKFYQVS